MGKKFSTLGYQTASLGKIWHTEGEPHGDFFDVEWSTKDGNYALPQNLKYNVAKKVDVKKGKAKRGKSSPPTSIWPACPL